MKRVLFVSVLSLVFCGLLSACSMISDPKPFPGLETSASFETTDATTALTEASSETEAESEAAPSSDSEVEFPTSAIPADSLEQQLQLILSCSDLWKYDASSTEICSYCVTDLDHNGRLEILMSSFSTTSSISYTQCLEVNETFDALTACVVTELNGDIQPMESVVCYTDGKVYCYAVSDKVQTVWQETNLTRLAMKLEGGKLTEEKLATATNSSKITSTDLESYYKDAEDRPITRAQYEAIYDTHFSGWRKAEIGLGWIGGNYSIPSLDMLRASYEAFTVLY